MYSEEQQTEVPKKCSKDDKHDNYSKAAPTRRPLPEVVEDNRQLVTEGSPPG